MKRTICSTLSVIAIAMVLGVPGVQAQSRLVSNVPFDFCLGDKAMAAGRYQIQSEGEQLAVIRNMESDAATMFIKSMRVKARQSGHARLVFDKYGDQYFLRQIWDGDSDTGIELSQSHREKELRLASSRFSDGPEIVTVAMK